MRMQEEFLTTQIFQIWRSLCPQIATRIARPCVLSRSPMAATAVPRAVPVIPTCATSMPARKRKLWQQGISAATSPILLRPLSLCLRSQFRSRTPFRRCRPRPHPPSRPIQITQLGTRAKLCPRSPPLLTVLRCKRCPFTPGRLLLIVDFAEIENSSLYRLARTDAMVLYDAEVAMVFAVLFAIIATQKHANRLPELRCRREDTWSPLYRFPGERR
jgi:hypothetical protein